VNGQLNILDVVMSSWFVDIPDQQIAAESKVYPNPFNAEFKIEYKLKKTLAADASIRVFDVTGRLIEAFGIQSASGLAVMGKDYPKGTYFVKISNGSEELKTHRLSKY